MLSSTPLTPVMEEPAVEPLVLSVGALRCRVANAKHLYQRVDECIKGTTYSQCRPSTFHNEEREILFQVGCAPAEPARARSAQHKRRTARSERAEICRQDLEQIYDALIGIMMNAPKQVRARASRAPVHALTGRHAHASAPLRTLQVLVSVPCVPCGRHLAPCLEGNNAA